MMFSGANTLLARRSARERVLLLGLSVVLLAWAGLEGAFKPLMARNDALAARIAQLDGALARANLLQASAALVANAPAAPVILSEVAQTFGLTISRLDPSAGRLRAVVEDAAFDAVVLWLDALEAEHGLMLQEVVLTRRPAAGFVNAALTVKARDDGQ